MSAGMFQAGRGVTLKGVDYGANWPLIRVDSEMLDEQAETFVVGGLTLTGLELFWVSGGLEFREKPDTCRIARDCKAREVEFGLIQSWPCEGGLCMHARVVYETRGSLSQFDWFIEPVPEPTTYALLACGLILFGLLRCRKN